MGFDLWTMQNNILFDNILLTSSEEEAKAFAERTWRPKHEAELALEAKLNTPPVRAAGSTTWRDHLALLTDVRQPCRGVGDHSPRRGGRRWTSTPACCKPS